MIAANTRGILRCSKRVGQEILLILGFVWTTTEDTKYSKVCEWKGSPAASLENYFHVGDLAAIALLTTIMQRKII